MQRLMGRRVNNGGIMGREVDRRMGGWVGECMGGEMDVWVGEWIDSGWMNGWIMDRGMGWTSGDQRVFYRKAF